MKFINVPISVEAHKGVPRRLRWGRRIYTVRRLLDFWILQSRWWALEEKRVYFRLETDQGVVEVYRGGGREEREGRREERGRSTIKSSAAPFAGSTAHPGGYPSFVEGDTHTRELRQTESPYRPDAADLAGRRLRKADGSGSESKTVPPKELPSGSPPETGYRWILSKVID